jgi:hypothetical protein
MNYEPSIFPPSYMEPEPTEREMWEAEFLEKSKEFIERASTDIENGDLDLAKVTIDTINAYMSVRGLFGVTDDEAIEVLKELTKAINQSDCPQCGYPTINGQCHNHGRHE